MKNILCLSFLFLTSFAFGQSKFSFNTHVKFNSRTWKIIDGNDNYNGLTMKPGIGYSIGLNEHCYFDKNKYPFGSLGLSFSYSEFSGEFKNESHRAFYDTKLIHQSLDLPLKIGFRIKKNLIL